MCCVCACVRVCVRRVRACAFVHAGACLRLDDDYFAKHRAKFLLRHTANAANAATGGSSTGRPGGSSTGRPMDGEESFWDREMREWCVPAPKPTDQRLSCSVCPCCDESWAVVILRRLFREHDASDSKTPMLRQGGIL